MTFDVGGGHCEVTEDGDDTRACFMDYHKCVIHFQMASEKRIQNFLDEFPQVSYIYLC